MRVIHYPSAFRALNTYVDSHNRAHPGKKLKTGAVSTARELVRLYGVSLLKSEAISPSGSLPGLFTNNRQLARMVKCCARTIQRHLLRLQEAGIITQKIYHGSNANYEVYLDEKVLALARRLTVEETTRALDESLQKAKAEEAEINKSLKTNCPHTYTGYTGNINNSIIAVDKRPESGQLLTQAGNILTGNTRELALNDFAAQEKNAGHQADAGADTDTRELAGRGEETGHTDAGPDPARAQALDLYTSLLWVMAKRLLYAETDLTQRQVDIARQLIRKLYEPVKTRSLPSVHQAYAERIALVSRYLKRAPGRFVQLPYLYFDTTNPHGFTGTRHWHEKYRARRQEVAMELLLGKQVRKFLGNYQRETARRKPVLEVFRQCENTLGKTGNPELVRRFYVAITAPGVHGGLSPEAFPDHLFTCKHQAIC